MAQLNDRPHTSTTAQRQRLVILGRRHGLDLVEVRGLAGGPLHDLSAKHASELITDLGGGNLPNPPGEKKSVYADRKPSGIRIMTEDHVEQIYRLGMIYFDANEAAFENWLDKHFGCRDPWKLTEPTAKRGGQVISILQTMIARQQKKQDTP